MPPSVQVKRLGRIAMELVIQSYASGEVLGWYGGSEKTVIGGRKTTRSPQHPSAFRKGQLRMLAIKVEPRRINPPTVKHCRPDKLLDLSLPRH